MSAFAESRFARASALNLVGLVLPLIVAVIAVPVAAKALGANAFSLIVLAWTITGYFGAFDLGFGRAIAKMGAELDGDVSRLRTMIRAAVGVQILIGAALAAIVAWFAPALAPLLKVPPELNDAAVRSFRYLAIAFPAIMIAGTYRGALEALRRFDLVNVLRVPVNSASYVITLVGAAAGLDVVSIIGWMVVARIAGALAHWSAVFAITRQVAPARNGGAELRALMSFGGWVSITNVLAPLINYLDRFMVSALVSLAAVYYYAAPYELTSKLMTLPGSLAPVLLPSVAAALAARDIERSRVLIEKAYRWSAALLLGPTLILIVFAPQILTRWLGAEYAAESANTLRLLAAAGFLNGLALIPFTALEALGRPDLVAKYHLLELPVYLAVAVIAIRAYGIEGAAMAWVVRTLLGLVVLTAMCSHVAKRNAITLRWGVARP